MIPAIEVAWVTSSLTHVLARPNLKFVGTRDKRLDEFEDFHKFEKIILVPYFEDNFGKDFERRKTGSITLVEGAKQL